MEREQARRSTAKQAETKIQSYAKGIMKKHEDSKKTGANMKQEERITKQIQK